MGHLHIKDDFKERSLAYIAEQRASVKKHGKHMANYLLRKRILIVGCTTGLMGKAAENLKTNA